MKKSMAGQGAAGALLLAGLMMSAGAMAASGDPVQGGSGTVTINVPIVTSTCSVAVPTEVNLDPVDINSLNLSSTYVEGKDFNIVFSNCKDKNLQMSVQAPLVVPSSVADGRFDSGDPDGRFSYALLMPKDADITGGGVSYTSSTRAFALDNTNPVLIKPGSDNYTLTSNVELSSNNRSSLANVGSALSASFTYNISYQ
ncbi:type 1 fimbrial protein [Salmonella enterica]|uniref:Type 1 fimbrial protein n=1 Tax=Salmonella enterica TaxID=28901 RepID=A0A5Z3XDY0_SALER|nr:type 1 fimbrial protein [Salmonella enterica]ECB0372786.1 type 1 fimbrial protein [Salmonella enterica subsp. enterica serovar Muenchen]EAM9868716.1 type 1 fimbrial protein [Salmonella enterica]EAP8846451.1 type 1 fimbrial protein [Salmonella enterica]EAQ7643193.1 type 1 fimbrial protein [Salmonella enterica]